MRAVQQHPSSSRRQAPRPAVWLSVLGLGLGACTSSLGPQENLGWIEASSPKQLEVDRAEYRHSIYFPTDSSTFPAAERARLQTFLETVQHELGVPIGLVSSGPGSRDKAPFRAALAVASA